MMEGFAADALIPPQLVGLGFSFAGMVLGSLFTRAAPHPHPQHRAHG